MGARADVHYGGDWIDSLARHSPPEVCEISYEVISDTETVFSGSAIKLLEKAHWLAENEG